MKYLPEGKLIDTQPNSSALCAYSTIKEAMLSERILEARAILCDREHNLHVDLGVMRGIIPRNECAEGIEDGSVRDIAIISRVNKPVMFKIMDIENISGGGHLAILSRRAVQRMYFEKYIGTLVPGDIISARVTHIEHFGVFCDIGAGISALLPIDAVSVSRIPHPSVRLAVNDDIHAVVKSVDFNGRVVLSMKELLGTWSENAAEFEVGQTVPGVVRSIESYGVFIELKPNLAGLAEYSPDIKVGQHTSVFIKSIIPEKMKIKLIIVDCFDADYPNAEIEYFINSGHIESFVYSPEGCPRIVRTVFE